MRKKKFEGVVLGWLCGAKWGKWGDEKRNGENGGNKKKMEASVC